MVIITCNLKHLEITETPTIFVYHSLTEWSTIGGPFSVIHFVDFVYCTFSYLSFKSKWFIIKTLIKELTKNFKMKQTISDQ